MTSEETLSQLLHRLKLDGYEILSDTGAATTLGIPVVTGTPRVDSFAFHVFVAIGNEEALRNPLSSLLDWPEQDLGPLVQEALRSVDLSRADLTPIYFFKVLPDTPECRKQVALFCSNFPESTHIIRLINRDGNWSDTNDAAGNPNSLM